MHRAILICITSHLGYTYMNSTIKECIVSDYILVFNNLLKKYGLSHSEVARRSGLNQPTVSRFCSGRDVLTSNYFQLIRSMPAEFQREYWQFLLADRDWNSELIRDKVNTASVDEIREVMNAILDRWSTSVGVSHG